MNKKLDRIKFVEDVKNHLLSMGAALLKNEYSFMVFRIEGKNNSITFKLGLEPEHKIIYSIFAKFDKMNNLTGTFNHKHNFHGYRDDYLPYLNTIKKYL